MGAITLIAISANSTGELAEYSLLAVGLMNSIMFPTIYGALTDQVGLDVALTLPALCYLIIAGFGVFARRPA